MARLRNVLLPRRTGVPIAQIRELFAAVEAHSNILGNPRTTGLLRSHLESLRSRQHEISRQIQQTAIALENRAA